MNTMSFELVVHWLGGLLAFTALAIILFGIWRGTQREAGRAIGLKGNWLRSWWFYLAMTIFFFWIAYLGWKPLPWAISPSARLWMLVVGSLLYFPAMCLVVWARLTLGKNYFVSTGFGAQLFKDHQLITSGPYAIVRHPMYFGLFLAALGALLIYFTWTAVYFACFAPLTLIRAHREETALSEEFGEQWKEYCQRVPMLFPALWKKP